jgi:hypothetical protein
LPSLPYLYTNIFTTLATFSKPISNIIAINEIHHENQTDTIIHAGRLYLIHVGIENILFVWIICKKAHKRNKAKNND